MELKITKMEIGLQLIIEERESQIKKHGYDLEWLKTHLEYYEDNQLINAAMLVLSEGNREYMPINWPEDDTLKLCEKTGIEALKVAGALIAAEISRRSSLL